MSRNRTDYESTPFIKLWFSPITKELIMSKHHRPQELHDPAQEV